VRKDLAKLQLGNRYKVARIEKVEVRRSRPGDEINQIIAFDAAFGPHHSYESTIRPRS